MFDSGEWMSLLLFFKHYSYLASFFTNKFEFKDSAIYYHFLQMINLNLLVDDMQSQSYFATKNWLWGLDFLMTS